MDVPIPTVDDVATLLRARTKVPGGAEAGTFLAEDATPTTRPTAEDVGVLLVEATDEVLGKVQLPDDLPADVSDAERTAYARRVGGAMRLYTAMLIELSYFPEQVNSDRSPYSRYLALYESRMKALIAEGESGEVQGEGDAGGGAASAQWWFPEDAGGLIGWQTQW